MKYSKKNIVIGGNDMEKGVFDVWVGNLGKYNEGKLIGEWVSLP